jgi:sugar O-acyltransferase (sialic acid O-acetyltransferase NeuD family)
MKKVVIFGTADFAQVMSVYITKDSPYDVAAFTVHERYLGERQLLGHEVVAFETLEQRFPPDTHAMCVAIGFKAMNRARTDIYTACKAKGYELITYVSSKALHFGEFEIGDNSFVFEGNVIQPFVRIGNNVVLWCGNHVGHHARIGDNCFVASHAVISGRVTIGQDCFVGVNATIRDGVTIAPGCVIGAGAVILRDTVERGVYRGQETQAGRRTSDQLTSL